jgi:hypothetical protein
MAFNLVRPELEPLAKNLIEMIHDALALRGHVHRQGAGFVLSFSDNKNGIEAKKGFVKAMVKSLTVMPERADLEMSNSMFTLHFTWK